MIIKKGRLHTKKGFTLIETLVGVAILVIAVSGPLFVAYQGVALGANERDQFIASYLGQDVIEFVRYKMVTKGNDGVSSRSQLMSDFGLCEGNFSEKCEIDTKGGAVISCPGGVCVNKLSWNTTDNYYGYGSGPWEETQFKREVQVFWDNTDTEGPGTDLFPGGLGGGTEYRVEVTVYWGKVEEKSLLITATLLDWRVIFQTP